MPQASYTVIGLMSGTSLDGVDLAVLRFSLTDGTWQFAFGPATTVPYATEWKSELSRSITYDASALADLDRRYTKLLAQVTNDFVAENGITGIDALCSHGHTILHRPNEGYTLQIGNQPEIADLTGLKTVCDFRVQDVALGGQGAPLVPIGDRLLFGNYDFCLNLGGFSNLSFEQDGKRIAYDVSPVNTVLNSYSEKLGFAFDENGGIAASGQIIPELLERLEALPYYKRSFPKSLGMEFVRQEIFPITEKFSAEIPNVIRTFTEHIALQLASAIPGTQKVLITGGGAYNTFLIERLRQLAPSAQIIIPDATTLESKEALIFGLLGVLKLRGENNVLASVTGARHDHSSGRIHLPHH